MSDRDSNAENIDPQLPAHDYNPIANTSLDPAVFEPTNMPVRRTTTSAARRLIEQRRHEMATARAEHRAEHHAAAQNDRRRMLDRLADEAWDKLRKHQVVVEAQKEEFESKPFQWEKDDQQAYLAFKHHIVHAFIASPADVRRYDILRWYDTAKLPKEVSEALLKLSKSLHTESHLRLRQKMAEHNTYPDAPAFQLDLGDDEDYAALRHGKSAFGFENGNHAGGVGRFKSRFDGRQQALWIISSLEVRKTLLEHATAERKPTVTKWVEMWVEAAIDHVQASFSDPEVEASASEEVLAEIEHWTQKVLPKLEALMGEVKKAKKDAGLAEIEASMGMNGGEETLQSKDG